MTSTSMRPYLKNALLITLPVLVLGLSCWVLIFNYLRSAKAEQQEFMLKYSDEVFSSILSNAETLNDTLRFYPAISKEVKGVLSYSDKDMPFSEISVFRTIHELLFYSVATNESISSVYIYYKNEYGNFISSSSASLCSTLSYYDTGWLESYERHDPEVSVWSEFRTLPATLAGSSKNVYTVYYRLFDSNNQLANGVIVCNLDLAYAGNFWRHKLQEIGVLNSNIFVLDSGGHILAQMTDSLPPTPSEGHISDLVFDSGDTVDINGNDFVVFRYGLSDSGFSSVSLVPASEMFSLSNNILQVTIYLSVFFFLVTVGATFLEMRQNHRNLQRLYEMIADANNGAKLPDKLPGNGLYDLLYNSMVKSLLEQEVTQVRLSEKKYKVLAMGVMALQSQINPHFLYNTLDSIAWKSIALTKGPSDLSDMVFHLSEIMRYSLSNPTEPVELRKEINVLKKYIDIQRLRSSDDFDVIWDVDSASLDCYIVKLLLQPILENAFKYAKSPEKGGFMVKIRSRIRDGDLLIWITDNGIGIPRDKLNELRGEIYSGKNSSSHIGLFNVHFRLKTIFGDRYGLKIVSLPKYGTAVKLTMPAWNDTYDIFNATSCWEAGEWLMDENGSL